MGSSVAWEAAGTAASLQALNAVDIFEEGDVYFNVAWVRGVQKLTPE